MEHGKVSHDFVTIGVTEVTDGHVTCHSHSGSHDECNMRTMGE